jgi:hypothetical protein
VSNSHLINSRTPKPRSPMDFGSPHLYSQVISRATPSRSDGPRDFAKLPRDYKSSIFFFLRSYREILDRGFLFHNFPYYRNSDDQNADGARPFATCPHRRTAMIVPGFSYGVPDSFRVFDTCPPYCSVLLRLWT